MPIGPILLTVLLVSIYFGLLEGVLDRMRLRSRTALAVTAAMLLGSLVELDVAPGLSVNVGGALIPFGLAIYLIATADRWGESVQALAAAAVTALGIYLVGRWFPPGEPTELNLFWLDAQYLYGIIGGTVGYLAGRSPRSGFSAGVLGVLAADVGHFLRYRSLGAIAERGVVTRVGGGGFWDTAVVAGVIAVGLAQLIGEAREGHRWEEV